MSINNNFNQIPSYGRLDEPNWEEFSSFLDSTHTFDNFVASLNQDSTPVQTSPLHITSLEAKEHNPATAVFERVINPLPTPEPQLGQVSHTQHKRPAETPIDAQTNKKPRLRDLQLLKDRRVQLDIPGNELCRQVNDHLKKTLSRQRPLNANTLKRIENDDATKKTIDAYYDHINTILDRASKELPVEIDPRPAHLQMLRNKTGLNIKQLTEKLKASGIELSRSHLGNIERGRVHKDVVDEHYTDIKNFLETFMSEQLDRASKELPVESKELPVEIDSRSAHLKMLRNKTGLNIKQLTEKLQASGIKLSRSHLSNIEKGRVQASVIDAFYTDIKNFLDTFMSRQNDI
jgi:transcriptional regulator with XRE-family HTH domain